MKNTPIPSSQRDTIYSDSGIEKTTPQTEGTSSIVSSSGTNSICHDNPAYEVSEVKIDMNDETIKSDLSISLNKPDGDVNDQIAWKKKMVAGFINDAKQNIEDHGWWDDLPSDNDYKMHFGKFWDRRDSPNFCVIRTTPNKCNKRPSTSMSDASSIQNF